MAQNNIPPPPPGFQIEGAGAPPPAPVAAPRPATTPRPSSSRYSGPMPTSADEVFASLIAQESGGRAGVRGPDTKYGNALGRTQVLPDTARGIAKNLGIPYREDLLTGTSPEAAAYQDQLGRAYLEEGFQNTGNARDALMYYHGGPDRALWGPKTNAYADEVLSRWSQGGGVAPVDASAPSVTAEAPPPPPGFEIQAEAQPQEVRRGTRDNPIDLTDRNQAILAKKGDWVRLENGDLTRAAADAVEGAKGERQGEVGAYAYSPNLADAIGAGALAASEQIPFLDESVAFTTGLATGEDYQAMRDRQAALKQIDNQAQRGARVAGGLAGFATGMLAPGGAYIGRGVGGADRALRAAQVGGGYGALYGAGTQDGGLAERLRGGAEGAALGAVTGGLVQRGTDRVADSILARATRRTESPSDARILSNAGVELTPGQMLGGGFKRAEDAMTSIPFMGDTIRGAQRRGLESFNDAAIADTLAQSGTQTTQRGRGRVRDVAEQFGRNYDAALDPVTDIPRPPGYVEALTALSDDPALPPNIRRNLRSLIANTVGRADESIDGEAWKRIDSELSADIRAADNAAANAPEQRLLRDKLREVRGLWSERLGAAAPDALEAVRATDDAYANFKIIQKAMSDAASAGRGGEASPASMNRAVRQAAGEGQYSRGAGRLQELSDAAMTVLPSSVPDSGTPLRSLFTLGGVGGGAAVLGNPAGQAAALAGGAGIGLGSLAYSRPVQSMLNRAYRATGREDVSRQAASLFDQVYQNPAAVPLYMQILERLQQEQAVPSSAQVGSQTQRQAQGPMR